MDKRHTPLLKPVEDAVASALGSYIEQLKSQIEALKQQVAQLQHREVA